MGVAEGHQTMGAADDVDTHDGAADDGGAGDHSTKRIIHLARIVDVDAQNEFITVGPSGCCCNCLLPVL